MKRLQRVALLWNWLPAFRAVAEVGGVRRAAAVLGTSPSALSRMISLLEHEAGVPLFDRVGQKLTLTGAGAELLERTRDAMRGIDEALVSRTDWERSVLLGTNHPWLAQLVEEAALAVVDGVGLARVEAALVVADDASEALLSGRLDVAVLTEPVPEHPALESLPPIDLQLAVYAAHDHALVDLPSVSREMLAEASFVVPSASLQLDAEDGWPSDLRRKVTLHTASLAGAIQAAARGRVLCVLPTRLAAPAVSLGLLRVLSCDPLPARRLAVTRRRPAGDTGILDRAVAALRAPTPT